MNCPICNGPLKENAKFCTSCGTNIEVLKETGLLDIAHKDKPESEEPPLGMPLAPPVEKKKDPRTGYLGAKPKPEPAAPPPPPPLPETFPEPEPVKGGKKGKTKKIKSPKAKTQRIKPRRGGGSGSPLRFVAFFLALTVVVIGGLFLLQKFKGRKELIQSQAREATHAEKQSFHEALQLIQKGSLKDGAKALEPMTEVQSVSAEVPFYQAFVLARQNKPAEALKIIVDAAENNPEFVFTPWSPSEETSEFKTAVIEDIVHALARVTALEALDRNPDPEDIKLLRKSGLKDIIDDLKSALRKQKDLKTRMAGIEEAYFKGLVDQAVGEKSFGKTNQDAPVVKFMQPERNKGGQWRLTVGINSDDAPTPAGVRDLLETRMVEVYKELADDKFISENVDEISITAFYAADNPDPDPKDKKNMILKTTVSVSRVAKVNWETATPRDLRWKLEVLNPKFR